MIDGLCANFPMESWAHFLRFLVPSGAAPWPCHCCVRGSCFHLALCVVMWVKNTLGLLDNSQVVALLGAFISWPVALAGIQYSFSILPSLLLPTPYSQ